MKFFSLKYILSIILLFCCFFIKISALVINNHADPLMVYNIYGLDKFYSKKDKMTFKLNLTPFYQHSTAARNGAGQAIDSNGNKVREGDMFGNFKMVPLFFGSNGAPAAKPFTFGNTGIPTGTTEASYLYFSRARRVMDGLMEGSANQYVNWPTTGAVANLVNPGDNSAGSANTWDIDKSYVDETKFDETDQVGMFSIPLKYEKLGLRGQFSFDFKWGLGVDIKSGIVDIKQNPRFIIFNPAGASESSYRTNARNYILNYLMTQESREKIAEELSLRLTEYHKTVLEDTHAQVYWNVPFDLKNNDDEVVVTFIPRISVGLWMPTGEKKHKSEAFSLPAGSDGFWGGTVDGAINLDFPGTVQLSFGGGFVIYGSKSYANYRVPTSVFQSGIYPWKAAIRKKMGPVWYVNASFVARDFLEDFSFCFDYVYAEHNKDSIKMRESDPTRNQYFYPGMLENLSAWRDNLVHLGIDYKVAPALQIGLGLQAHISGARVYKTTTILGTMTLVF